MAVSGAHSDDGNGLFFEGADKMRRKIKLGPNISIDLSRLIETRLLIQANSGAGKSFAIRKLLEETHGEVQQIVLDMEGEFSTLREKFDYVLAGKGGDVEASPRTAELLARKILKLGVSLIVDLYELKKHERILFVKNFAEALVNAPKELWHPAIIVIDEAHVFVPEKGESAAASAVTDLATRGRKRGFCTVLATQRLSKLNKDAAAECLNKLIGRTSLDIDRKRASDELGFFNQKDSLTLRSLKPGNFFSFGPAISDEVIQCKIGEVKTSHPKAGQRLGLRKTRPTNHIRAVLKKLDDLPKEAETEIRDINAMRNRIKELEIQIRKAPKEISTPDRKHDQKSVDKAVDLAKKAVAKKILRLNFTLSEAIAPVVREAIMECNSVLGVIEEATPNQMAQSQSPAMLSVKRSRPLEPGDPNSRQMGACERRILGFLNSKRGQAFSKVQIGAMTGYRHSSGGFNNSLSKLSQMGLIQRTGTSISLAEGADVDGLVESVPHRLEDWISKLGACEREIYKKLLSAPGSTWDKQALGAETGYSATSGGFNNALSRLNTLGLMVRDGSGLRLNQEVVNASQ